ncbi:MAG TPA: NAD(P)-dependent oxidoreductase [Solirubrobacteraceae bacterium]|jgi:lactate dehydrogenase-like 2-hydroxyacid dehydrogenase|nr:NAD(P)-dependent oxidoreductase [Solirubrobacteraceae bacterium]
MARILVSLPIYEGALDALAAHELIAGEPGSEPAAEAILCGPTHVLDAEVLSNAPELRAIAIAGAGSDAVDHEAARARGIELLTAGEALVQTTADLAFGLIIAACRGLGDAERTLRAGRWQGWRFDDVRGRDVHGARLGLVGYGAIARAVARRAGAFEMTVRHHARHATGEPGFVPDLDELLAVSEIVSVHVPLTDDTRGLIDRRRIGLLPPGAVLVNTARGAVVDEDALAEALESGRLLAAGVDVYSSEPAIPPRLLAAPRTVLLPHLGSATEATRRAMQRTAAEKLASALQAPG